MSKSARTGQSLVYLKETVPCMSELLQIKSANTHISCQLLSSVVINYCISSPCSRLTFNRQIFFLTQLLKVLNVLQIWYKPDGIAAAV